MLKLKNPDYYTIYIRNLGLITCATEKAALEISEEYIKRNPEVKINSPIGNYFASMDTFFNAA